MIPGHAFRAVAWLVLKDLRSELRLRRAWPAMALLGLVLVLLLELQLELPAQEKQQVVCGLLWLDVFFAGTLALERTFAGEREEGCWRTLRLYPVPLTALLAAKMAVNFLALALLEAILIPAFAVFSNVALLERPWHLLLVAGLSNLGFVAIGVLVSAATTSLAHRGSLLPLLQLVLITPVLLAAAEATRLLALGDLGLDWWRWVQLLGAFAVVFATLGTLLFEYVVEE